MQWAGTEFLLNENSRLTGINTLNLASPAQTDVKVGAPSAQAPTGWLLAQHSGALGPAAPTASRFAQTGCKEALELHMSGLRHASKHVVDWRVAAEDAHDLVSGHHGLTQRQGAAMGTGFSRLQDLAIPGAYSLCTPESKVAQLVALLRRHTAQVPPKALCSDTGGLRDGMRGGERGLPQASRMLHGSAAAPLLLGLRSPPRIQDAATITERERILIYSWHR